MHIVYFALWSETIKATAHLRLCACNWRVHAEYSTVSWRWGEVERTSETSPVWCARKDFLWLNKCTSQQEKETEAAVVSGVANTSPAPVLILTALITTLCMCCILQHISKKYYWLFVQCCIRRVMFKYMLWYKGKIFNVKSHQLTKVAFIWSKIQ